MRLDGSYVLAAPICHTMKMMYPPPSHFFSAYSRLYCFHMHYQSFRPESLQIDLSRLAMLRIPGFVFSLHSPHPAFL